jgi:hypothetical protein
VPKKKTKRRKAPRKVTQPSSENEPREIGVLPPRFRCGVPVPPKERELRLVSASELVAMIDRARADGWPEAVAKYEGYLRRLPDDKVVSMIDHARIDRRWSDVAKYAADLHARTLPVDPWSSESWRIDLRDRLHALAGRWGLVTRNNDGQPDYERLAASGRILRALDLAFASAWAKDRGGADVALIGRLDATARPYLRRVASADPGADHDAELDRPAAAEFLKDWWAAQLMGFASDVRRARDHGLKPRDVVREITASAAHAADLFVAFVADGLRTMFAALRADLPGGWDARANSQRVANALSDLVQRDVVDVRSGARVNFDDLGERMAGRSLTAIGYPKVKSLFDRERKRVKPPLR